MFAALRLSVLASGSGTFKRFTTLTDTTLDGVDALPVFHMRATAPHTDGHLDLMLST